MLGRRIAFVVVRLVTAGLIIAAVIGQLLTSFGSWHAQGVQRIDVVVTNFFSFFTIDSNLLAAAAALIGAVMLIVRRPPDPRWFLVGRASVTTFMVITGLVYNTALRGIELPQGTTLAWSNEIVHLVAPLLVAADWCIAPGREPMRWRTLGAILVFPIVWTVYTMLRGPHVIDEIRHRTVWYPYPFLDPVQGAGPLAISMVLVGVAFLVVGGLVVLVTRRIPA